MQSRGRASHTGEPCASPLLTLFSFPFFPSPPSPLLPISSIQAAQPSLSRSVQCPHPQPRLQLQPVNQDLAPPAQGAARTSREPETQRPWSPEAGPAGPWHGGCGAGREVTERSCLLWSPVQWTGSPGSLLWSCAGVSLGPPQSSREGGQTDGEKATEGRDQRWCHPKAGRKELVSVQVGRQNPNQPFRGQRLCPRHPGQERRMPGSLLPPRRPELTREIPDFSSLMA